MARLWWACFSGSRYRARRRVTCVLEYGSVGEKSRCILLSLRDVDSSRHRESRRILLDLIGGASFIEESRYILVGLRGAVWASAA